MVRHSLGFTRRYTRVMKATRLRRYERFLHYKVAVGPNSVLAEIRLKKIRVSNSQERS